MRSVITVLLLLLASPALADSINGLVSDPATSRPIEGATVHLSQTRAAPIVVRTGLDGWYRAEVAPGTYDVIVVYGLTRAQGRVTVAPGHIARLDAKLDAASGEVIELQGIQLPPVAPKSKNFSIRKAPPYSERMMMSDGWTRAWLWLQIGSDGKVARFKFLKRPGYDLEDIAIAEAFKLRFEPARDDRGQPTRGWVLWGIEWPANSLLVSAFGIGTRLPRPESIARAIPCRGSGPWSGAGYYRDCSEPDWKRASTEPWIDYDPARKSPKTAWD